MKLHCYASHPAESSESLDTWGQLLEQEQPSTQQVQQALLLGILFYHHMPQPVPFLLTGVPPSRREEVWQYLSDQFQARSRPEWQVPTQLLEKKDFQQLSKESTEYEHNIMVDLSKFHVQALHTPYTSLAGRTFPSHPYFSSGLQGAGQSELHSILHAYAVADPETGYCQGLSFVAGLILMHVCQNVSCCCANLASCYTLPCVILSLPSFLFNSMLSMLLCRPMMNRLPSTCCTS